MSLCLLKCVELDVSSVSTILPASKNCAQVCVLCKYLKRENTTNTSEMCTFDAKLILSYLFNDALNLTRSRKNVADFRATQPVNRMVLLLIYIAENKFRAEEKCCKQDELVLKKIQKIHFLCTFAWAMVSPLNLWKLFVFFFRFCAFKLLTLFSWYQNMCPGGSGPNLIVHVKFIVLPLSTNRSCPPNIVATGSKVD